MKLFIDYRRLAAGAGSGAQIAGNRIIAVVLACALGGIAGSAYGETCNVGTTGVSFGVYDVFSSGNNDAAGGNIRVSCEGLESVGVSYNILLSTGGGSYASRSMSSGSNHLNYNLYTTSGYSIVWGDGTGGTETVSGSFPPSIGSAARDHTVYGRIPAQQNAYVGIYSDTITVTVNY
jgi:spore coat protein U-like protein